MKVLKVLVLAATMVAALIALIAAGTASATVLCSEQGTGSPTGSTCLTGKSYAAGTSLHAVASGVTKLTTTFKTVECEESTIAAKTENAGKSGEAVKANVETLSFGKCNCTVSTLKKGSLSVSWTSGSHNGTLSSTSAELTVSCSTIFGTVHCLYATENTDLGTATGGNPSKIDIESANVPRLTTSAFCSEKGNWDATYEITSPKPLYYSGAVGSGATETTLTTSLSGEEKSGEEITVNEGAKVKDTATLSGTNASKATGTVKYKVYADKECKELVTNAGEVTVSEGKVPASEEKELEAGRVYYWQAEYSGDTNNLKSTSTCGKEVLTVKAATSIATSLSGEAKSGEEITVNEGAKVKDTATLSGTKSSTATGKVKFRIYKDKECKELAAEAGEGSLSEGKATSEEKALEAGAVYYWQAEYPGDSLHQASTSTCGKEILTVKAAISISTSLQGEGPMEEAIEGAKITVPSETFVVDTTTFSGTAAASATGTVTYKVYKDKECKELVTNAGEVEVKAGKVPESEEEMLSAGTYYWRAEYSGDSLHQASSGACGAETTTVKAATGLTTALVGEAEEGPEITVAQGAAVTDSATLSGASAAEATGTVTYKVYSDGECEELVAEAGEVEVKAGVVPNSEAKTLSPGTYYWQASYSGDTANYSSEGACGEEVVVVIPTVTTTLSGESESAAQIEVLAGATVSDQATLNGENASTATGTVTYKFYSDEECKELVEKAGEFEVKAGKVAASEAKILPQGVYYWQAEYSGDPEHPASSTRCGEEIAQVLTSTTLTTNLSGGSESGEEIKVEEGTEVTDTATLSGTNASSATGYVAYSVYADSECKELVANADTAEVEGSSVPASAPQTLPPGTYYWQAEYSGDGVNRSSQSACGSEIEIVTAPITLILSGGEESGTELEVPEEAPVTAEATLHGPNAEIATGTVEYEVYSDPACEQLAAEAGEVEVKGATVPLSEEEAFSSGNYYWRATYSGDEKNPPAESACQQVEQIVLGKNDKYAAIGDSYSSGEGAGKYYAKTNYRFRRVATRNLCHRSEVGWPARVAEGLFGNKVIFEEKEVMKQQPPSFIFRACSGGVTANLWSGQAAAVAAARGQYNEWIEPAKKWLPTPAQDLWLELPGGTPPAMPLEPNPNIRLVTLTIGGNDAGFATVAEKCIEGLPSVPKYTKTRCMQVIKEWLTGVPGPPATLKKPSDEEGIPSIPAKLEVVLNDIRTAAPNARIRIPLYPRPLRLRPRRDIPVGLGMDINNSGKGVSVAEAIENYLARMNATIQRKVQDWAKAKKADARVIPATQNSFLGHQLGDKLLWMNKIKLPWTRESFHPSCLGHIALAETVLRSFGRAIPKGWKC